MPSIFTLAAVMALAGGAAALPQTPANNNNNNKGIIGGEEATNGEFPYIVSLQTGTTQLCGGALIREDRVLTAAHCLENLDIAEIIVRGGSNAWDRGGKIMGVDDTKIHPSFSSVSRENDLAVLHLSEALSGTNIGTIGLPTASHDPFAGDDVVVAGWGTREPDGTSTSGRLYKVTLPVISRATCQSQYNKPGDKTVGERQFCTYVDGKDSCSGDSGGPAVDDNGYVVGIVSWGPTPCATTDRGGVYTRVGSHIEWIAKNL